MCACELVKETKKAILHLLSSVLRHLITQFEISPKDIHLKQTVFPVFINLSKNLAFLYNQSSLFVFKKPSYYSQISSKNFFLFDLIRFQVQFLKGKSLQYLT